MLAMAMAYYVLDQSRHMRRSRASVRPPFFFFFFLFLFYFSSSSPLGQIHHAYDLYREEEIYIYIYMFI